jgi:uncharacterized membrane protein YdbT with pleckstrin-like domain
MSGLLGNLQNTIAYNVHKAVYNPEAQAYAEQQAKVGAAAKAKADAATAAKAKAEAKATADAKAAADAEAAKKAEEERGTFSGGRMIQRSLSLAMKILLGFLIVSLGILGASLATNLNAYKPLPFRILYFFYGLLGFFIVIPYVLFWRWAYKGLRPEFYGLFPIIQGVFTHPVGAFLFSWLCYRPLNAAQEAALNPCMA